MVDSGATGNFFNTSIAIGNQIGIIKKNAPYRLSIIDGETIGTDKRLVTHETDRLQMIILKGYIEEIVFDLVAMRTHAVIFGMPWLCLYNPYINWRASEIIISQYQYKSNYIAP